MKTTRKIIEIDEALCNGCGACVPGCAEAALKIVDGKARLVAEIYCDGLGACLGQCPTGALTLVEREAEDFSEDAVHQRIKELEQQEKNRQAPPATMPCGCPGSMERTLAPRPLASPGSTPRAAHAAPAVSSLTQWPVKLELVRPEAPFLRGADLLVAADCAAAASPDFHAAHLHGKTLVLGCPKFGPADLYLEKLAAILQTAQPASVTVLRMEVPCCAGLAGLVERAARLADYQGPVTETILALHGEVQAPGAMPGAIPSAMPAPLQGHGLTPLSPCQGR